MHFIVCFLTKDGECEMVTNQGLAHHSHGKPISDHPEYHCALNNWNTC